MKLRLSVASTSGRVRNLQVTTDATATVGDVAAALAGAAPSQAAEAVDPASVTLEVMTPGGPLSSTGAVGSAAPGGTGGRLLDSALALNLSAVRSGSIVAVRPATRTRGAHEQEGALVTVVAGPHSGQTFSVPVGTTTIGRSSRCGIALSNDRLVSKEHVRLSVGATVEVTDLGSANGVHVGEDRVHKQVLADGDVVTIGQTSLRVSHLVATHAVPGGADTTDVDHVRCPRVVPRTPEATVSVPQPPTFPEKARFPLLAMVAPVIMGAVLYLVMHNVMSLIFVALSPLIMIGNWVDQRVRTARTRKQQTAEFEAAVIQSARDLTQAHVAERAARLAQYPSTAELVADATRMGPMLWSRRPEHPEFLQVRLALGSDVPRTKTEGGTEHGADPRHDEMVRKVVAANNLIADVPLVCNLREDGSLGLVGQRHWLDAVSRAVMAQVLLAHSPAEVVLVALTNATSRDRWSWLEWMPHCCSPHSPIGSLQLASDGATGTAVLARLEELIATRLSARTPGLRGPAEYEEDGGDTPTVPSVVVLVDSPAVDRKRLTRVVEQGPDVGIHVIWITERREDLPAACRSYMEVSNEGASVGFVRRSWTSTGVSPEMMNAEVTDALARLLAPVVDGGVPVDDASDLPASISYVTLTGHELASSAQAQVMRWRANHSLKQKGAEPEPLKKPVALSALVGQGAQGPVALDLRVHGPHALVGGTTGAGKSEFLQSWVLGMAQALSPDRVTFLFVDYKGGSAFARCTDLPHCVGLVTDLSPAMVRRALTSLRAELRYREHLLNRKGAKDLVTLEMRGDPECPPSLVIVVDEFAALVNEVPEFVDGVVDVAQRGRSLGLHLILATQRPSGVIKDNLRANTNLRVALRMADEQDSQDVLGDKSAAHFPPETPGRAAAKTGPGRVTPFQSAYPGARTSQQAPAAAVTVEEMTFGAPRLWQVPRQVDNVDDVPRDIDRVVDTVAEAARQAGVETPRKPWLPELATAYDLNHLPQRRDSQLLLGVVDDPENQSQYPAYFSPDTEANIVFYGAGGSGKSTALRSLAVAAGITPRSGPVDVYAVDAAGGALSMIESMPHVGGVIDSGDTERVRRLMIRLRDLVDERGERYSAVHADTITSYREIAGAPSEPRVLLLVDGIGAWRTELEKTSEGTEILEMFTRVLLEGRAVGVHVAASAERSGAMPTTMASSFLAKVVLRQSDETDYYAFGVPKDVLSADSPPGRALLAGSSRPQEVQLAILGESVEVVEQAKVMEAFGQYLASKGRRRPEPIRSLPAMVCAAEVEPVVGSGQGAMPVIGMASEDLAPLGFGAEGALMVAGPPGSGRSNALCWLSTTLKAWDPQVVRVLIGAPRSLLSQRGELWDRTVSGSQLDDEQLDALEQLLGREVGPGVSRVAVFVESYPQYLMTPSERRLIELVKLAKTNGHTLVAEGELSAWGSSMPLIDEVRKGRQGLLLQPDNGDCDLILRTPAPRLRGAVPPGRGLWVQRRKVSIVQVPWAMDGPQA